MAKGLSMQHDEDDARTKTNPERMGAYRPGAGYSDKRLSPDKFDQDDLLAMNPDLIDLDATTPEDIGALPEYRQHGTR